MQSPDPRKTASLASLRPGVTARRVALPTEDGDICSNWWEANDIDNIVGVTQDNCSWGELSGSIKQIETPAEGWKLEEEDEDEEEEEEEEEDQARYGR